MARRFAKWKRDSQFWFVQDSHMFQRLLGKVADDLANGIDRPSFGATIIKTQSKHGLSELEQAWLAGDTLAAGGETTSTTLHWWVLAMLVYPNVQARAHAELDEVVGRGRPPTFADCPTFFPISARWSKRHCAGRQLFLSVCRTHRPRTTGMRACSSPRARSASRTCACSTSIRKCSAATRQSSIRVGTWMRRVGLRC
ncbi:hypothetical protein EDB83DRAFT_733956 [Lactarius deliciosus]|nr:hypothetical protein EDB83DRAFT_733956 [Lactarius deliciosus]